MDRLFSPADNSSALTAGVKVLIVDDEPRLADSLTLLLDIEGFNHHVCTQGQEALSVISKENFDVILLDIGLPDISGHDVLKRIRDKGNQTPVIIVSGESSIDAAIRALREGVYDFVRKPYEPEQLLQTVRNAVYKTRLEKINRDIQERLEQSKDLYRFLVNGSPDFIYILDNSDRFSFVNKKFEDLLGISSDQIIGKHYSALVHEEDLDHAMFAFNQRGPLNDHSVSTVELRFKGNTEEHKPIYVENKTVKFSIQLSGINNSNGTSINGTYGVARDIGERKRSDALIAHQTYHDGLTNLPNRVLFKDRLEMAINQARRDPKRFAIMFIDLDRFKFINDTMGHKRGDELLISVADRLRNSLDTADTLARIGGDEFSILLTQVDSIECALERAKNLLSEIEKPLQLNDQEVFISASIGISVYPDHGEHADQLIKSADIAMYHVKWVGKNDCMTYDPKMNEVFHQSLSIETDLRKAIEAGQLVLNFQPQIDIKTRSIVGMESLVRWHHPTRGIISPITFIPLAEESGLITKITEWVFEATCIQYVKWIQMGITGVRMSVNFSPQDIERDDFVSMVKNRLAHHGLDGQLLEIEITEGTIMRDMVNSINKLKELGSTGIKVAIDDFGTGYSSLSYIKQFPVHSIKIDKSFVQDIQDSSIDLPIVSGISLIARGFGMNLIAEGVETVNQMDALTNVGCNVMQGYLFSRPLNIDEATHALLNQPTIFSHIHALKK